MPSRAEPADPEARLPGRRPSGARAVLAARRAWEDTTTVARGRGQVVPGRPEGTGNRAGRDRAGRAGLSERRPTRIRTEPGSSPSTAHPPPAHCGSPSHGLDGFGEAASAALVTYPQHPANFFPGFASAAVPQVQCEPRRYLAIGIPQTSSTSLTRSDTSRHVRPKCDQGIRTGHALCSPTHHTCPGTDFF